MCHDNPKILDSEHIQIQCFIPQKTGPPIKQIIIYYCPLDRMERYYPLYKRSLEWLGKV